jgi:hypothetical protein
MTPEILLVLVMLVVTVLLFVTEAILTVWFAHCTEQHFDEAPIKTPGDAPG